MALNPHRPTLRSLAEEHGVALGAAAVLLVLALGILALNLAR